MAHAIIKAKQFGYQLLEAQLKLDPEEKERLTTFIGALKGDFWQDGKTLLPPPNPQAAQTLNIQFQNRYVSRNIIQEAVARVSSAFLGKAPNWAYVIDGQRVDLKQLKNEHKDLNSMLSLQQRRAAQQPPPPKPAPVDPQDGGQQPPPPPQPEPTTPPRTQAEADLAAKKLSDLEKQMKENEFLDEIETLLGEYWNTEGLAEIMISAFEHRLAGGRGALHVYLPRKFRKVIKLDSGETVSAVNVEDIQAAFKALKVEFVKPEQARMLDDEGDKFTVLRYEIRDDYDTEQKTKVIEFSFVDDEGMTFIGVLKENSSTSGLPAAGSSELSQAIDLDENTTLFEMVGEPYITEQVFKLNQGVNLALTCGGFNIVDNGFGEMVLTNVDLETETVPDPDAENGVREVPKRIIRGGGAVNNFTGVSTVNLETAQEQILTPGVHFREPSSMQTFMDGKDMYYSAALEELGQKYALISGDATASGEARIQAMADFYLRVRKYKSEVDRVGGWLLTTLLRFASVLCGRQEEFKNVSVIFDSKIKIGNFSASERDTVLKMQAAGVISMETCRVLLEIEDPKLEEELILKEKEKEALMTPMPVQTVPVPSNNGPGANPSAGPAA